MLVAPPEEARRARELLPEGPPWRAPPHMRPIAVPGPARRSLLDAIGPVALLAFLVFSVVDTVGALAFFLLVR